MNASVKTYLSILIAMTASENIALHAKSLNEGGETKAHTAYASVKKSVNALPALQQTLLQVPRL